MGVGGGQTVMLGGTGNGPSNCHASAGWATPPCKLDVGRRSRVVIVFEIANEARDRVDNTLQVEND